MAAQAVLVLVGRRNEHGRPVCRTDPRRSSLRYANSRRGVKRRDLKRGMTIMAIRARGVAIIDEDRRLVATMNIASGRERMPLFRKLAIDIGDGLLQV